MIADELIQKYDLSKVNLVKLLSDIKNYTNETEGIENFNNLFLEWSKIITFLGFNITEAKKADYLGEDGNTNDVLTLLKQVKTELQAITFNLGEKLLNSVKANIESLLQEEGEADKNNQLMRLTEQLQTILKLYQVAEECNFNFDIKESLKKILQSGLETIPTML